MARLIVSILACLMSIGAAHAAVTSAPSGTSIGATITYSNYSVLSGQNVTIGGSVLDGRREVADAGEIELGGIDGGTTSIDTFCIDIDTWLQPSGTFKIGSYLTGSFADAVNALVTHVLPTFGSDANASAALQVAIWKVEYGDDLTVTGNKPVKELASTFLAKLASGAWRADPTMRVGVLDGEGATQSQVYVARVPEPASLALIAAGLLGLAVAGRYRSRFSGKC